MAWWLRHWLLLWRTRVCIPSTHLAAHDKLKFQSQWLWPSSSPLESWRIHGTQTYKGEETHEIKINIFKGRKLNLSLEMRIPKLYKAYRNSNSLNEKIWRDVHKHHKSKNTAKWDLKKWLRCKDYVFIISFWWVCSVFVCTYFHVGVWACACRCMGSMVHVWRSEDNPECQP